MTKVLTQTFPATVAVYVPAGVHPINIAVYATDGTNVGIFSQETGELLRAFTSKRTNQTQVGDVRRKLGLWEGDQ